MRLPALRSGSAHECGRCRPTFIIKVFARETSEIRQLARRMLDFVRGNLQVTRISLASNLVMGTIATHRRCHLYSDLCEKQLQPLEEACSCATYATH